VRVLELGQVIAGPFCGQLLGYTTFPIPHYDTGLKID
jgi:hypothetical protein